MSTFLELGPGSVLTGMAKRTVKGAHTLSITDPADLDDILDALAQPAATARGDEGEGLAIRERLLVSPGAGVFTPSPDLVVGRAVAAGDLVGHVGAAEFRSPFSGTLMGVLAVDTERVMTSQPLAWLQACDPAEPSA